MRTFSGERLKKNPTFEWEYNAVKHLKGARKSPINGLRDSVNIAMKNVSFVVLK